VLTRTSVITLLAFLLGPTPPAYAVKRLLCMNTTPDHVELVKKHQPQSRAGKEGECDGPIASLPYTEEIVKKERQRAKEKGLVCYCIVFRPGIAPGGRFDLARRVWRMLNGDSYFHGEPIEPQK